MADSDKQIKGVIVQIFGDDYQISSQSDAAQVQRIAAYVDEKMRQIAVQHSRRIPKTSLAVLASMEITSELFQAMREQNQLTEKAQENLERLTRLIDEQANISSSLMERGGSRVEQLLREQSGRREDLPPVE